MTSSPEQALAAECVRAVKAAISFELDGTNETLPVLDHYAGAADLETPDVIQLTAAYTGAYFASVLIARYPNAALKTADDVLAWELSVPAGKTTIRFNPVGVAIEVLTQDDAGDCGAAFQVPPSVQRAMEEALKRLPPVGEREYYSFSSRVEVLDHLVAVLSSDSAKQEAKN